MPGPVGPSPSGSPLAGPSPSGSTRSGGEKVLNGPLKIALAGVLALAVAVVVVLILGPGSDDQEASPTTTTTAAYTTPPTTEWTITSDELKVAFDLPTDTPGLDVTLFSGPDEGTLGTLEVAHVYTYPACPDSTGADMLVGLHVSDSDDLLEASTEVSQAYAEEAYTSVDFTNSPDEEGKSMQTASGESGEITSFDVTREGDDGCGNSKIKTSAFAIKNASDETIVVLTAWRLDGKTGATPEDMQAAAEAIYLSLRLTD